MCVYLIAVLETRLLESDRPFINSRSVATSYYWFPHLKIVEQLYHRKLELVWPNPETCWKSQPLFIAYTVIWVIFVIKIFQRIIFV